MWDISVALMRLFGSGEERGLTEWNCSDTKFTGIRLIWTPAARMWIPGGTTLDNSFSLHPEKHFLSLPSTLSLFWHSMISPCDFWLLVSYINIYIACLAHDYMLLKAKKKDMVFTVKRIFFKVELATGHSNSLGGCTFFAQEDNMKSEGLWHARPKIPCEFPPYFLRI